MAPPIDPRYDTSTWGGYRQQGTWWNFHQAVGHLRVTAEKVVDAMQAWLEAAKARQRTAVARGWLRATSDPLPPSVTPRPLLVRRELQRAGPTGFRRLGGRRPL